MSVGTEQDAMIMHLGFSFALLAAFNCRNTVAFALVTQGASVDNLEAVGVGARDTSVNRTREPSSC